MQSVITQSNIDQAFKLLAGRLDLAQTEPVRLVVCGGSALIAMGLRQRTTRDVDVVALLNATNELASPDPLPEFLLTAAAQVARDLGLFDNWLNNGPMQLGDVLPADWRLRVRMAYEGAAVRLDTLGRADLLSTKVFALCDRGTDLADCLALAPTAEEIAEALPWFTHQDANPDWPAHVAATLADLQRRLGHDV